jgi:hypothetical protein
MRSEQQTLSLVKTSYEPLVSAARTRFTGGEALASMLAPGVAPERLELFFIHFCAFGVQMTEPVDGWIRRAGDRCTALGLGDLGRSLIAHAKHEAGHHLMMIADTRKLVAGWNERRSLRLDAEELLALPATPGVARYAALHEQVIAGSAPQGQLAIEYEIERLSVTAGPAVLGQCATVLGREALAGLSFLEEHVAVDAGHTKFNEVQLERLLTEHPDFAAPLGAAGSGALDAYAAFLADCVAHADARLRSRAA